MREVRAVLAIDQGRVSGVAIGVLGHTGVRVGIYQGTKTMQSAVTTAVELAGGPDRLFVVFEDHSKIPASKAGNTATLLGMGDARGSWHTLLDLAGVPRSNRVYVAPGDYTIPKTKKRVHGWRTIVLGRSARFTTEQWKQKAIDWVRAKYRGVELSADAAEAACILEWALLRLPWEEL